MILYMISYTYYRLPILTACAALPWKTTWSPATAAKDNFGHSAAFSGSVSATAEGPRHDAIPSTWQATAFEKRTVRYIGFK